MTPVLETESTWRSAMTVQSHIIAAGEPIFRPSRLARFVVAAIGTTIAGIACGFAMWSVR